jgi:hypothetical protein
LPVCLELVKEQPPTPDVSREIFSSLGAGTVVPRAHH